MMLHELQLHFIVTDCVRSATTFGQYHFSVICSSFITVIFDSGQEDFCKRQLFQSYLKAFDCDGKERLVMQLSLIKSE